LPNVKEKPIQLLQKHGRKLFYLKPMIGKGNRQIRPGHSLEQHEAAEISQAQTPSLSVIASRRDVLAEMSRRRGRRAHGKPSINNELHRQQSNRRGDGKCAWEMSPVNCFLLFSATQPSHCLNTGRLAPQPPLGDEAKAMHIEDEIRGLREALESAMHACGHASTGLDDEQFAGRLRRCLMSLTGGDRPLGFDYAGTKTPTGDFLVTLVWSEEAGKTDPQTSVGFSAHGPSETLAFLRAAQKVVKHPAYRQLLFRSAQK